MVLDLTERVFSHPSGETGRNIIFGVGMSSSTKIENQKKYILILDKGPTQGLKHTLSAEKMYSINFTENYKTFCLSHYNGTSSYLFVNDNEVYTFKAKDSEIVAIRLCLGNISRTNETRYIEWHKCKCECRLDANVCNNK